MKPTDTTPCMCGHVLDEHGGDGGHLGSTGCHVEGCGCIAFETNHEANDE